MAGKSLRYYPNPDDNFVLSGNSPHTYTSMPWYFSSSTLTDKSRYLPQQKYQANKYADLHLKESQQFTSDDLKDYESRAHRLTPSSVYDGTNKTRQKSSQFLSKDDLMSYTDWYTNPIHLTWPVYIPLDRNDMLAARYFPVTLGEVKALELVNEIQPGRSRSRSRTAGARQRSLSATSQREQLRDEIKRMDNTFYLTDMAPHIKAGGISFTSPYDDQLAKLRMEKLRIEEKQYLELKRQAELERIRGPVPKWYELRTPEFHYEARKNNELLRNSDKWDDLLRYREQLVNASRRLKTALEGFEVPVY